MQTLEKKYPAISRSDEYHLYVLGDIHVGALNCLETKFLRMVDVIKNDPNAIWIGGGDVCDHVILQDSKRFDPDTLPDWMLEGGAEKVRKNVSDIVDAQCSRFVRMVKGISDKCIGLIEGNHEYTIKKHHNRDVMRKLCGALNVPNLTDCAFIRLKFMGPKGSSSKVVTVFICHGQGGGRTSGAEPNRLHRLAADKVADIILTGHSHTFHILPPFTMLSLPSKGSLLPEPIATEKHVANWGSYLSSYKQGPSTYVSRALYPVRPVYTVRTNIVPMYWDSHVERTIPKITMHEIKL